MKKSFLTIAIFFSLLISFGQQKAENIIIITLDGFRWQEVFNGADDFLINSKEYVHDTAELKEKFWATTAEDRRKKLLPFLWSTVVTEGQLHGNRKYGSKANVLNCYQFSYPGYNEIFTGYPDTAVNSNDKILNPNENVLEFINRQKNYKTKVAAFTTWDVFPYILNEQRSGIYVNADVDTLRFSSPAFQILNEFQFLAAKPIGVRPDVITYMAAKQYVKEFKPKVLYIAFDETDDFAHNGMYDQYLLSAHAEDAMIHDLWDMIQSMPEYQNKTALIISCDHGRGDLKKEEWTSHSNKIAESGQTWMAFLGKGIDAKGEIKQKEQIYQAQLAQTIAALLGFKFIPKHPVEKSILSF
jgi:hypothetical protein